MNDDDLIGKIREDADPMAPARGIVNGLLLTMVLALLVAALVVTVRWLA